MNQLQQLTFIPAFPPTILTDLFGTDAPNRLPAMVRVTLAVAGVFIAMKTQLSVGVAMAIGAGVSMPVQFIAAGSILTWKGVAAVIAALTAQQFSLSALGIGLANAAFGYLTLQNYKVFDNNGLLEMVIPPFAVAH